MAYYPYVVEYVLNIFIIVKELFLDNKLKIRSIFIFFMVPIRQWLINVNNIALFTGLPMK